MGFSNLPIVTVQKYRTGSRYEPQFFNTPYKSTSERVTMQVICNSSYTFNIAVVSASVYKASTSLDK